MSKVVRLLLLVVGINACWAVVVFVFNNSIVGSTLSLVVASVLFGSILFVKRGLTFRFVAIPAVIVVVMALICLERSAVSYLLERYPPPRPAFCDKFEKDEWYLLPSWHLGWTWTDREGQWAWADNQDVVLLVVVTGEPRGARTNPLLPGPFGCRVKVGADRENHYISLPRMKNTLAVVLPDGSVRKFAMQGKGNVPLRLFCYHFLMNSSGRGEPSLLDARKLLDPSEEVEFEKLRAELASMGP